ncbi:hypothetical protein TNCV_3097841 [Trichonephila clavipes]|nr:hypothetical protein TNCV_3097841 [Trichonephila clavipes]
MKHGYLKSPRDQINSRRNCDTNYLPSRSKPNKRCESARLWQQCSGTGAVFCWWTLYHKERRSTQVPTAQLYGSSIDHCEENGAACCQKVFYTSTITQDITLHQRLES